MSEQIKKSSHPGETQKTPFGTFEIREHSDDLTLDLRGHSAEDLFQLAGLGLARLQCPGRPEEITQEDEVEIVSDGWDDQIVNWVNQLIFHSEKKRAVWSEFAFDELDEQNLRARIRGCNLPETPGPNAKEIRAASYVGVEIIPGPVLWQARLNLDL